MWIGNCLEVQNIKPTKDHNIVMRTQPTWWMIFKACCCNCNKHEAEQVEGYCIVKRANALDVAEMEGKVT